MGCGGLLLAFCQGECHGCNVVCELCRHSGLCILCALSTCEPSTQQLNIVFSLCLTFQKHMCGGGQDAGGGGVA